MPETFDVVIVGGAVTGSAAAYFLMARDPALRVLQVERDPTFRDCATARSVASVRHQFSTPENIRMSLFGTEFFRGAAQTLAVGGEAPDLVFRENGYLFLATAAGEATLSRNIALQQSEGADIGRLDRAAIATRFPWLRCDDLAVAGFGRSGEGWLDAHSLMTAFRRKAQSLGARFRAAAASRLLREGRRVFGVELVDGTPLHARWVINAAGTGAAALAASAGIALPVHARKRCVFHVRSPLQVPDSPLVIDPGGVYFRPEGAGWLCGVAPDEANDPDSDDLEVDHALFDDIVWPALASRVPAFEALRVHSAWAGHYDVHPLDHNAILGPHPEHDGLLFANGFSGHGLQHAPAVGRALAEWVLHGASTSLDLGALGWQRVIDGRPLLESNVV